ncbi:hypothetical protein BDW02DRAFT_425060 [Decorospora gaudefroyi]|uniref:DUF6590 domain-containing protein n=1 Tax=Decorospora gaudefroyi TaxID=184978 RepID=A0A6A5KGF3_9PLEO|nr:hypothetical protein BDW02DRAFT_425060 [Decorospora gaudefroyi]
MATNGIQWLWSPQHQRYYHVTYNADGSAVYHWQNESPVQPVQHVRIDSPNTDDHAIESVPAELRPWISGLITGTSGPAEALDSTYFVRTGNDARRFFIVGRVFAMLYSDAVGNTASINGNDDAYSAIRFGEQVYSNIRRFVVVKVCQGFVYACGITTYSNRGTLKAGCVPSQHSVVYFTGTDAGNCYIQGEWDAGMWKDPIEVEPANGALVMKRESRIRFSKTVPIEMNVKVKDIGRVHYAHMSKLVAYWEEEFSKSSA